MKITLENKTESARNIALGATSIAIPAGRMNTDDNARVAFKPGVVEIDEEEWAKVEKLKVVAAWIDAGDILVKRKAEARRSPEGKSSAPPAPNTTG